MHIQQLNNMVPLTCPLNDGDTTIENVIRDLRRGNIQFAKVTDPLTGKIAIWRDAKGAMPVGCRKPRTT